MYFNLKTNKDFVSLDYMGVNRMKIIDGDGMMMLALIIQTQQLVFSNLVVSVQYIVPRGGSINTINQCPMSHSPSFKSHTFLIVAKKEKGWVMDTSEFYLRTHLR